MHQLVQRTRSAPARPILAVLALAAVLAAVHLLAAPAAGAAEPTMRLPETTVFHVHLMQAGGTAPAAAQRPVPAALQRLAGRLAAEAGQPLVLLGTAVLATSDRVQAKVAGPAGLPAELDLDSGVRSAGRVHLDRLQVAGSLREILKPQLLLQTSVTLPLGEPVVAGTSYLGAENGTLIVVVEARAAGGA